MLRRHCDIFATSEDSELERQRPLELVLPLCCWLAVATCCSCELNEESVLAEADEQTQERLVPAPIPLPLTSKPGQFSNFNPNLIYNEVRFIIILHRRLELYCDLPFFFLIQVSKESDY